MADFNKRTVENAHKIYFVAKVLKDEVNDLVLLSRIFSMPKIDFDVAAWAARDLGLIKINDDNTFDLLEEPKEYQLSELTQHLMDIVPILVAEVNANETVIEEEILQGHCNGFPQQDIIMAIQMLVDNGTLALQEILDREVIKLNREERRKPENEGKTEEVIESTYYFYTLPENADKDWHEKQFKDAKKLQNKTKEQPQAK